jgi:hypothetical protein
MSCLVLIWTAASHQPVLAAPPQRLVEEGGVDFGASVAIAGGLAVVGAPGRCNFVTGGSQSSCFDQGAAYVYELDDAGTADPSDDVWVLADLLFGPNSDESGVGFGARVATNGSEVAVADDNLYGITLFSRIDDAWAIEDFLPVTGAGFAMEGNLMAIGHPWDAAAGLNAGAVRIYERNAGAWTLIDTALPGPSPDPAGARLGRFVALADGRLVASAQAPGWHLRVFKQSGGAWTEEDVLEPSGGLAVVTAVAMDRNVVVAIGIPATQSCRIAYVFEHDGATWTETAQIELQSSCFIHSVAVEDDRILLGDRVSWPGTWPGTIHRYERSLDGWKLFETTTGDIVSPPASGIGHSLATSGSTAITGSGSIDTLIYELSPPLPPFVPQDEVLLAPGGGPSDRFGLRIGLNGSGTRAVVGAEHDSSLGFERGKAYVFEGASWSQVTELAPNDLQPGSFFGMAVGHARDLIAVGAPGMNGESGKLYTYRLVGGAVSSGPQYGVPGSTGADFFGSSLAMTEGSSLLVVGALGHDDCRGAAFVYIDTGSSLSFVDEINALDGQAGDVFGEQVATSGTTIAVAAPLHNLGAGAVYLFELQSGQWTQVEKLEPSGDTGFGEAGVALSTDGQTLVVGGFQMTHVYRRSAGNWELDVQLEDKANAQVALSGDGTRLAHSSRAFDVAGVVELYRRDDAGSWIFEARAARDDGSQFGAGAGVALDDDGSVLMSNATLSRSHVYAYDLPVFAAPTRDGTDVAVTPADGTTGELTTTITFDNVTAEGTTTVTSSDDAPVLPTGFAVGDPATYYEIATTASFSGDVEICIDFSGITFDDAAELQLLHYEDGAWVAVPTNVDETNEIVCGVVSSLSPFAIVDTANAPDPQQMILDLIERVAALNLANGIENSLDVKLEHAHDALVDLSANNDIAAVNALHAFINAVNAQAGNMIPELDAFRLQAAARDIIDLLLALD